ncbi:MAG: hypothetical protein ACRYFS_10280 [Janthinobacterium lividum]
MSYTNDDYRDDFFWVIKRCIDEDEDVVRRVAITMVTEVPKEVQEQDIKELLIQSGRFSQDQWKEHKVLPRNSTDTDTPDEYYSTITYFDLLKETQEEKRVTLRLPIGLHLALTKAAKHLSVNQLCINVLSEAIGYNLKTEPKQNRQDG